jgi:hypothetical protein
MLAVFKGIPGSRGSPAYRFVARDFLGPPSLAPSRTSTLSPASMRTRMASDREGKSGCCRRHSSIWRTSPLEFSCKALDDARAVLEHMDVQRHTRDRDHALSTADAISHRSSPVEKQHRRCDYLARLRVINEPERAQPAEVVGKRRQRSAIGRRARRPGRVRADPGSVRSRPAGRAR